MTEFFQLSYETLLLAQNSPSPPLLSMRMAAKYLGPNQQEHISQAVNSPLGSRLSYVENAIEEAVGYLGLNNRTNIAAQDTVYHYMSWIIYNIGKGDDGCGNWAMWAMMTMFGNFQTARDMLPIVEQTMPKHPQGIHPELDFIFKNRRRSPYAFGTHFSAATIPKLNLRGSQLEIRWPADLLTRIGTAPRFIDLSIMSVYDPSKIVLRK